jgi:type VI secretion system protein ImpG
MSDRLLYHYEKELAFIKQSASEFAKQHPSAAENLQLGSDSVDDPLVARLLSGFAFLNARIQQKLSDDFPELTDAMLETLYPHYLRPIPSMAITQFSPLEDLDAPVTIPAGTELVTDSTQNEECRFTTKYPVELLPIRLDSAQLMPKPFIAPGSFDIQGASAVLKLSFKSLSADISIAEMDLTKIRLFLKGQAQHVHPLYDLMLTKCFRVVIANDDADIRPTIINADALQQVGFDIDEGLLPYPDSSFMGYRLLTEFFSFQEKFQFIDFTQLDLGINDSYTDTLNIYLYLRESDTELEHQVNVNMFALGCTPVVNIFEQTADPIPLTHTESEYPIIPDSRRRDALEIYSVIKAGATDSDGKYTPYRPFYGIDHSQNQKQKSAFWLTSRREIFEGEHRNELASEMNIRLVDLNFNPHEVSDQTLDLQLLCTNRNQPKKLPSGQGQPYMEVVDNEYPTERISCVVNPGATIRPPLRERGYWRLISHLNLNHLSLSNGGGSAEALKEILRLYDFRDSASTRNMIDSIVAIHTHPITAPIQIEGLVSLCRGTQIELTLDPIMLAGTSPLMFASVLERFFGLYGSINSFTRLAIQLSGKDGEFKRWPPRAGEKALI